MILRSKVFHSGLAGVKRVKFDNKSNSKWTASENLLCHLSLKRFHYFSRFFVPMSKVFKQKRTFFQSLVLGLHSCQDQKYFCLIFPLDPLSIYIPYQKLLKKDRKHFSCYSTTIIRKPIPTFCHCQLPWINFCPRRLRINYSGFFLDNTNFYNRFQIKELTNKQFQN